MSGDVAAQAVVFGAATQHAHTLCREAILDGTLLPGSQVTQAELARQLDVTRTPLREALRLLEREGLVQVRGSHQQVEISALSMVDMDALYAERVTGEAIAIQLTIPTLYDHDFAAMESQLAALGGSGSLAVRRAAHRDFHATHRMGAGQRLTRALSVLFDHAQRYQVAFGRATGRVPSRIDEHRAIYEACLRRDAQQASLLLIDHIAAAAETVMSTVSFVPVALPEAVRMARSGVGDRTEPGVL